MESQDYNKMSAGKTLEQLPSKRDGCGLFPEVRDSIYCCHVSDIKLVNFLFHQTVSNSVGEGFHPDVTPDMVADFMFAYKQAFIAIPLMKRFYEYEKIYEAVGILLSKAKYYMSQSSTLIRIECVPEYLRGRYSELNKDQFIFIMDILADKGYLLSLVNNISIDYFEGNKGSFLNRHVTAYKQLCNENTKMR